MKSLRVLSLVAALSLFGVAQEANQVISPTSSQVVVPRLIRFSGQLKNATGTVGITFTLHKSQQDETALWIETQNVQLDSTGKYTVLLGATKAEGIPTEMFASGEAQWLGIRVENQPEQPRVLLVSVPYALRAAEADTLAGHAPADFVTTDKLSSAVQQQMQAASISTTGTPAHKNGAKANSSPTMDAATDFTDTTTNQVVLVTQNGTGAGLIATAGNNFALSATSTNTAIIGSSNGATHATAAALEGVTTASQGRGIFGWANTTTGVNFGLYGQANSVSGTGIAAASTATTGTTVGLEAQDNSPNGTAAVIQARGGGKIISGQTGATNIEKFAVDSLGNVTAAGTFTGNGSGLTGIPKLATGNVFSSYLEAYQTSGPGNAAVLGWGSKGSVGLFGDSDTGYGVQGESNSGFGVYAQIVTPAPGSSAVLGFTGNVFSSTYTNQEGYFNAGIWADSSNVGTGVPSAFVATADDAFGGVVLTNGVDNPALYVANVSGAAIEAEASTGYAVNAMSDSGTGIIGDTAGSGSGVEGYANSLTAQNAGVLGVGNTPSVTYGNYNVYAGVWGDTGTDSTNVSPAQAIGVLGTADDSHAGMFLNNSSGWSTMYIFNTGSGGTGLAVPAGGAATPGLFATLNASTRTGTCGIGGNGDLTCTGQVKTLATTAGGAHTVETYAMHSPENWMEDFGSGSLQNGVAVVNIDPTFAETISATADYHIFITPKGDSKGLYVARESANSFEVRESGGGTSSLSFDYRIVAKRRGYEAQRLTDVTERFKAEQKAMERHAGPPVQTAVRPRPSPLMAKSNAKPVRKAAGLTPQRHAVATQPVPATRP